MKPNIFISSDIEEENGYYKLSSNYYNAIEDSGGTAFTTSCKIDNIEIILRKVDGILFTGGLDIGSNFYNEKTENKSDTALLKRDNFEILLMKKALELKIPILGICRGAQLLNVVLGGTLTQHIEKHLFLKDRELIRHKVKLVEDGKLKNILKVDTLEVNSVHHQVINKLGKKLKIECYSEDNYIEGISYDSSFAIGIQWHPEMLYKKCKVNKLIFSKFIKVSSKKMIK